MCGVGRSRWLMITLERVTGGSFKRRSVIGALALCAVAACGVVSPPGAHAMIVPVPPAPPQAQGVGRVDLTGRFYLGASTMNDPNGRSRAVRVDRLTGAQVELPEVTLASWDLRWVVTVTGDFGNPVHRWVNVDTGVSQSLAGWAPGAMSANGQAVLASGHGGVWLVPRSGTAVQAPVPANALIVDLSPNGRWALVSTDCIPNVGLGCRRYLRWDTTLRSATEVSADEQHFAYQVFDDGSVLQAEWLSGNGFTGGDVHMVRRALDGTSRELVAVGVPAGVFSDDGSTYGYVDSSRRLIVMDTTTHRTVSSQNTPQTAWTLAPTGAFALKVQPAPQSPLADPPRVTLVTAPGRSVPPKVRAKERVVLPVRGVAGVPDTASSVVLNVTVTNPAGPGFATVWPCDRPKPNASNVNFSAVGVTVANAVIAKITASGSLAGGVCVASSTAAEIIVDVQGYFTGTTYTGVTPDRFLDTRAGDTDTIGNTARGERLVVPVAGVRSVPADATAVAVNVTLTNTGGPGFATVWPCDRPKPRTSNINVTASGVTVANAVVARVATSGASAGAICVTPSVSSDVIVDVQGYFTGSGYTGVVPDRFADTRNGESDTVPNVRAGGVVTVPMAGVRSVPDDATAVVVNATATNTGGPGFLTVWPCDRPRPTASNVNFSSAGATVANAVVAKLAVTGAKAGTICVFSSERSDVIIDVQGYFTGDDYTGLTPTRTLDTRG